MWVIVFLFLYAATATASVDPGTGSDLIDRQALVKRATQGSAEAQYTLGTLYVVGKEESQNHTEAAKWLRKAAEQGHVKAQGSLALMYAAGLGVERNVPKAAKWFREAAEQGDGDAQVTIAAMYYYGLGVPQSKVFAYQWAKLAIVNPSLSTESRSGLQEEIDGLGVELTPSEITKTNKLVEQWEARTQ